MGQEGLAVVPCIDDSQWGLVGVSGLEVGSSDR